MMKYIRTISFIKNLYKVIEKYVYGNIKSVRLNLVNNSNRNMKDIFQIFFFLNFFQILNIKLINRTPNSGLYSNLDLTIKVEMLLNFVELLIMKPKFLFALA